MTPPTSSRYDENHYDVIVLGSGPSGQKAAIQSAKLKKRVAIVEPADSLGGVSSNTGTIPSKSFREAVLYLTGFRERSIYGPAYRVKSRITMSDLTFRIGSIVRHENHVIEDQLSRNKVEIIRGRASFADPHTVVIEGRNFVSTKTADHIVIAVGTRPHHPPGFEVDGDKVLDSDDILTMKELPRNIVVVGGGVIGVEYASMFAVLGVEVTLVEQRKELLSFVDREVVEALQYHLRNLDITLRLGEEVSNVSRREDGQVETHLKSGKKIVSEAVLVSAGRQGAVDSLNLELVGLKADKYGRLKVNEQYQTEVPHIYAVGDVIGFPALASTGMSQGRIAASHAFGIPDVALPGPLPYGIWTIPEISLVGETEDSLTQKQIPYETGVARYKEIARGHLIGDELGMLKILFHRETRQLLGVHIIGEGACEIVHVGQSVLSLKGGLDYLVSTVFNYPTLTECYKVAALDGLNKIRA
ncbi:MAG: Si-specific NAD(P)(+) transhydrogenase [Deltaproteobacteria bacterium]|nr:Si-specific NAD(P)(+) transhydrogenase [Deltaproteobacteria bacterium]